MRKFKKNYSIFFLRVFFKFFKEILSRQTQVVPNYVIGMNGEAIAFYILSLLLLLRLLGKFSHHYFFFHFDEHVSLCQISSRYLTRMNIKFPWFIVFENEQVLFLYFKVFSSEFHS